MRGRQAPPLNVQQWITPAPDPEGKVVVVDLWATWCRPCIRSIPHMNQLATRFEGEVVIVVAPAEKSAAPADVVDIDAQLGAALESLGVRDAAAKVAAATGVSRRELYTRALALTGRGGRSGGRKAR